MKECIANLHRIISSDIESSKYVLEKQILSTKKVYGLYNNREKEENSKKMIIMIIMNPLIITSYRKRRSNESDTSEE
jgi:hypothetical protein